MGDKLAIVDRDGFVRLWNRRSNSYDRSKGQFSSVLGPIAWSSSSSRLASIANRSVRVWGISDSGVFSQVDDSLLTIEVEAVESVSWIPNTDTLVTFSEDWEVERRTLHAGVQKWDGNAGTPLEILYEYQGRDDLRPSLGWTSNFSRFAYSNHDDAVTVLSGVSLKIAADATISIMWSPDDRFVATEAIRYDTDEYVIAVWDAETGRSLFNYATLSQVQEFFWTPNSRKLILHLRTHSLHTIQVLDAVSTENSTLYSTSEKMSAIAVSPNSGQLALAKGNMIKFIEIADGKTIEEIAVENVRRLSWSPDGSKLALGMADGTIRIWDVAAVAGR